jgi:hypothetical protein
VLVVGHGRTAIYHFHIKRYLFIYFYFVERVQKFSSYLTANSLSALKREDKTVVPV